MADFLRRIDPYYNIAERVMTISKGYTQDSTLTTMMLEILRGSGFPEVTELPTAIDLTATKFGQVHSNALFSSIAFLGSALNQRPFDLAVNARAVQILSENGSATGLQVMSPDKKSYFIKAKPLSCRQAPGKHRAFSYIPAFQEKRSVII